MKKMYKILLIISIALAGSGLAICIAGFFLGGSMENVVVWDNDPEKIWDGTLSSVWDAEEEEVRDVDSLCVDMARGSLIVEYGRYDNIRVESGETRTKTKVWMEGNTLNIKGRGRWTNKGGAVKVYLPENIHLREADFEVGAGTMEVDRLQAENITIEVGAGEFVSDEMLKADVLDLSVGMGDIQIAEADSRETYLDCSMGNLDIAMKGNWDDYYLTGECSLGDLSVEEESWNLNSDISYGDETAERIIDAECGLGALTIGVTDR